MAGILEQWNDPSTQGALSLSSNLLRSAGPSAMPVPFGSAVGNAYQGYLQNRQQQQLLDLENLKGQLLKTQVAQAQRQQALFGWILGGKKGPMPGTEGTPTSPALATQDVSVTPPGLSLASQAQYGMQPNQALNDGAAPNAPALSSPQGGLDERILEPAVINSMIPGYGALYGQFNAPTDAQKNAAVLTNANTPEPIRRALIADSTKAFRPGGYGLNALGQVQFFPKLPENANANIVNGQVQSVSQIPGSAGVIQTNANAATLGALGKSMVTNAAGETGPMAAVAPNMLPSVDYAFRPAGGGAIVRGEAPDVATATTIGKGIIARPGPAVAGSGVPASDPWASIPKPEIPNTGLQTTYQKGVAEERAKATAELSKKYGADATTANQRLAYNTQASSLLDQATTGPLALSIGGVKNFLTERIGIPASVVNNAIGGDPNATAALNKDLLNSATQKAKSTYGPRMTQSEVMLQIKQASPNVDMTKATIKYLLNTDSKMSEYQVNQATALGKYLGQGGDPYQFEGWYAKNFPISSETEAVAMPGNTPAPANGAQTKTRKYNPATGKIE